MRAASEMRASIAEQYSDAKLQSFVVAAMKVSDLIDQWTPRIQAAKTAEEKAQLKGEAQGELAQAIQSTGGITVQEYQQIGRRAEGDQALQERIMKIVQSAEPQPQK